MFPSGRISSTPKETVVKRVILCLCLVLISNVAVAETQFQLALPSLNIPSDPEVDGMRLSFIWGKNRSTNGFDLGILSVSETSDFSGLALVGGVSRVTGRMDSGVAFSLVNYHSGSDSGVNGAFINLVNDTQDAFNTGFVTIASGTTSVDVGGVNVSKASTAQIGFINVTKHIKSFQLGFINMADNGFLPVFPFVNFPKR
jgi:hypothetical protein